MTRTLYIVRHAKAEDRGPYQRDHDRELVPEGIMAAARMGHHLHGQHVKPDRIISSTAPRARDTARMIAEQLQIDPDTIVLDEHLFDGGPRAYLSAVNALPADCQSVMLVGHNPDTSYFAEFLTRADIGNMEKGAVVAVDFDKLTWAEVTGRMGTLLFHAKPDQLKNS